MLTGKEKCRYKAGAEIVERYRLDGDCEKCRFNQPCGVHMICYAAAESGKVTRKDCEASGLTGTTEDFSPEARRCYLCNTHYKPNTKRCSECIKTPNLDHFKPSDGFKAIIEWWEG